MVDVIVFLSYLGIPIGLLTLGLFAGRLAEKRHYKSIHRREKLHVHVPASTTDAIPEGQIVAKAELAVGSVVVSVDHFKRFLSKFRMFVGGELGSYAPLIDRGRREAILRMREQVPSADAFLNCRLQTSTISSGNAQQNQLGTVEVVAYGTAIFFQRDDAT